MKSVKSSFYNVLVPVEEEREFLLYNIRSGGLEVLSDRDGQNLRRLMEDSEVEDLSGMESLTEYLYQGGYLVDKSVNERQDYLNHYLNEKASSTTSEVGTIGLTIGTTITCNMGCPYCFEFEKPNKTLKDDSVIDAVVTYIEDMIAKSPVKHWTELGITWYGGEPLINYKSIEKLTPKLKALCERHGIAYTAMIITNGLLLTENVWKKLKEHDVLTLQITIDGAEETHNLKRPLKTLHGENYKRILQNLAIMPPEVNVTIRINVDKNVAKGFLEFFNDLQAYGIWPQKYRQVKFNASWLRPYAEITDDVASDFYTNDEFFDVLFDFKMIQLEIFNAWAEQNNTRAGKLRWLLPSLQQDCAVWVSPYDVVVDPEGYLQKCWETVHDSQYHIRHITEGYNADIFKDYTAYNKVTLNEICENCNIMPVCERLSCSFEAIKKGKPDCTYWKTRLPDALKRQYLMLKHNPDIMGMPEQNVKKTTHANNK